MKTCSKCKTEKPVTEFGTDKATADGFRPWCKACLKAYFKAYSASRRDAKQSVVVDAKVCLDCGLKKPISQFGKKSNELDKHNIYCKPCWNARCKISIKKYRANAKRKD